MEKQLSLRQYRLIDLSLFALIGALFEFVLVRAATVWFPDQLYSLSGTALVSAIVLMRWGAPAALHMVLGGLVFALAGGARGAGILIYTGGNLAALLLLPAFRGKTPAEVKARKQKIAASGFRTVLFGLGAVLLMQAGRAALSLLFGGALKDVPGYFLSDALSDLFTPLVLALVRKLDGVFEDQKSYLFRKQAEFQEEKRSA